MPAAFPTKSRSALQTGSAPFLIQNNVSLTVWIKYSVFPLCRQTWVQTGGPQPHGNSVLKLELYSNLSISCPLFFLPSPASHQPQDTLIIKGTNYLHGLEDCSHSQKYIYIYISFSPSPHLFKALQRIFKRMLCKNPSELPCFSNLHLQPILLILNTNNCLHRH